MRRPIATSLQHAARLLHGRLPGQLVIQLTERCNARCPQCNMNIGRRFARATLVEDTVKRILERAAAQGVAAVSFTGGEPLLEFDSLLRLIQHAAALGIRMTRTGTNAFFLARPWEADFDARADRVVQGLAATALRNLWISLDSPDASTHERLRGLPGVMAGIAKALPRFHAAGIYPAANLGLNRYAGGATPLTANGQGMDGLVELWRKGIDAFLRRVIELGFTTVNFCYPMSIAAEDEGGLRPVYAASATTELVSFRRVERQAILQALLDIIPRFRRRIRVFTPRSSLLALLRQHEASNGRTASFPCLGGHDFFFVAAKSAHLYPCGFRGMEDLGAAHGARWPAGNEAVFCTRCDWECFRDPSTLAGPFLQAMNRPLAAARSLWRDHHWRALWCSDLAYYQSCGWFDGRRKP
jgi:hypothetical protein